MGSTVIGGVTYPEMLDQPLVPSDLRRVAEEVMRSAMPRFASAAERTAAYATLGITPTRGATCWLDSALRCEVYVGANGWAALPGTILKRGRRSTSSSGTTTEVGVLRLDDLPIIGGQAYNIWTSALAPDTTVANDVMTAKIRYTTDGSTPTTASPILSASKSQVRQPDASNGESVSIACTYQPTNNETLSLLLTVARTAGTGTVLLFADGDFGIELVVQAGGFDTGDEGTEI